MVTLSYDVGFAICTLLIALHLMPDQGRGGKGTIYVWAAGNGGTNGDSCAMDGYVSSIYTIAVGSVDQYGHQAPYDEDCSSKLAVTFNHNVNSRNRDHIVSIDLHSPSMLPYTLSQLIFIYSPFTTITYPSMHVGTLFHRQRLM